MPDLLAPAEVQRRLGLTDDDMRWLLSLRRPPGVDAPRLPDRAEAETLLQRLGVDPDGCADTLAARPDPDAHPALWWVLDRVYHDILAAMDEPVPVGGFDGYPSLPASAGAMGRYLPMWVYLALLPAVRRFHDQRGIPESISWRSLGDALTVVLRQHRERTGEGGLGRFGWTLPLRVRGVDYRIGRLAYNLGTVSLGNRPCGYVLGVHIPPGGPLDIDASLASMEAARAFFERHFPDCPFAWFACESWLMDPQLAEYLDARSNIVRFQRLFTILPLAEGMGATDRGDDDMLGYVFGGAADGSPAEDQLDRLPQGSTLQRAFVRHLRAGRHWHVRTGWRPVR